MNPSVEKPGRLKVASDKPRREYNKPELVAYGPVALLTRSFISGCSNDGSTCTPSTLNMGMGPSDRRLKENIVEIGKHALGIGLYLFDYKPEFGIATGKHLGVMADELETVLPEAVSTGANGFSVVDYAMLDAAASARSS